MDRMVMVISARLPLPARAPPQKNRPAGVAVIIAFGAVLAMFPALGQAQDMSRLYRGARAQAMGGAFIALADDEQAVFMNPAGLAGIERSTFHYLPIETQISTDVITTALSGGSALGEISGDTLNTLMGKNIYASATSVPTLIMPNFGVSFIVDTQTAVLAENQALPRITLGYQTTNGIQAAFGYKLKSRRRAKNEFRIGVGAKLLYRRGGYQLLSLTDLLTVNQGILSEISGNFEEGIGLDLGAQYLHKVSDRLTLSAGTVFTDIGDTTFGGKAQTIKGNFASGVAATYQLRMAKARFAYDYHYLIQGTDWRKKSHTGLELELPMISLYGGINQVSLTYGASVDFWLARITAYSYGEELGAFAHQDTMRRWGLKIALKYDL